jgi:hypothetical protein
VSRSVQQLFLALLVCTFACVASGVQAQTALGAYGDHEQATDPAAWSNLSTEDQNALMDFLSRGTPAESAHFAATPDEQAKAQELEDAYSASRSEEAKAALTGDEGAAAQRGNFVPPLDAIHAYIPWPILVSPETALFTFDVLLVYHDIKYALHMGDRDIPDPPPAGTWSTTSYQFSWHSGGAIYSVPAPQNLPPGVYAQHVGPFSSNEAWSDDDPNPRNVPPYPFGGGDRFYWDETHGNYATDGQYLPDSVEYFVRVQPGEAPFAVTERPRPATSDDGGPTVPWAPPSDPRGSLAQGYGAKNLSDFRKWVCHVLGLGCPDPYVGYHVTPDCAGMTYDACVSALRDVGFMGKVDEEHLTVDDAYIEGQAGRVTTTRPGPNLSIVEDREFEVFINPDPLPLLSATEQNIASSLQTANPDVVTEDNKRTIARSCVRRAANAGRPTSDCLSLPIFITGNDAGTPARNDIAGLAVHPQWFALNRRSRPPHVQWWKKLSPPPGCVDGDGNTMTDPQCDEFPFWSTLQAYGGTLQTAVPRVLWTPQIENNRQGQALLQFYGTNTPGPTLQFAGCNVAVQSQSDTVPALSSTFLNLPLPPGTPIRSTGICNRAARGLN